MINKDEIEKGNALIAKFMGGEYRTDLSFTYTTCGWINTPANTSEHIVQTHQFRYHSDYNWIIPVVEKIETMKSNSGGYWGIHIASNTCTIQDTNWYKDKGAWYYNESVQNSKIEAVWVAIVNWITWYNKVIKRGENANNGKN